MTPRARFAICPLCHGVHKGIPECVGRPQTDAEWMLDRGVAAERIPVILAARARAALGSLVLPPDPGVLNVPPYGVPAPRPATPAPAPVIQEALF